MLGLIEWRSREMRAAGEARETRIGGARFLAVSVIRGTGLRATLSRRRAVWQLRRRGVTRAIFPRDFSGEAYFTARGIVPVEAAPLRAWLAADIALCAMRERGIAPKDATAALCAASVDAAVRDTAERLAREVRYLRLCTARGGWELARALRRTLGIAVAVEPLNAQTAAEVTLCFDAERTANVTRGLYLPLLDRALRLDYTAPVLTGYPEAEPEQLLAALHAAQTLRREEVTVRSVYFAPALPESRQGGAPSHA